MIKDIKSIFDAITPENLRDVPAISDAVDIFIETLEELSQESIDIKNIYENDLIREELIKIYLDDIYHVFKNIQYNQKIVKKIDKINSIYNTEETGNEYFNTDALYNITKYLNDEHFLSSKSFKQKKGTVPGLKYIYDLISVFVNTGDAAQPFTIIEKEPFNLHIKGSLPEEFFEYIVRPLANPMGFIYFYEQIILLKLEDFFPGYEITYTINDLQVRCLETDGSTKFHDYKFKIDPTTGEYILDENGFKVPRTVVKKSIKLVGKQRVKTITFADGTYLEQVTTHLGQTTVSYKAEDGSIIMDYTKQCSIYDDLELHVETSMKEEFPRTDEKWAREYFGRLDLRKNHLQYIGFEDYDGQSALADQIGEFRIGTGDIHSDLHDREKGWNLRLDRDGNIVLDDSGFPPSDGYTHVDMNAYPKYGRLEHYFAPTNTAMLKFLEGKYEKDVDIYDGNGVLLGTQPIFYTDAINPEYQKVPYAMNESAFIRLNENNHDFVAREHHVEILKYDFSLFSSEKFIREPIYDTSRHTPAGHLGYNEIPTTHEPVNLQYETSEGFDWSIVIDAGIDDYREDIVDQKRFNLAIDFAALNDDYTETCNDLYVGLDFKFEKYDIDAEHYRENWVDEQDVITWTISYDFGTDIYVELSEIHHRLEFEIDFKRISDNFDYVDESNQKYFVFGQTTQAVSDFSKGIDSTLSEQTFGTETYRAVWLNEHESSSTIMADKFMSDDFVIVDATDHTNPVNETISLTPDEEIFEENKTITETHDRVEIINTDKPFVRRFYDTSEMVTVGDAGAVVGSSWVEYKSADEEVFAETYWDGNIFHAFSDDNFNFGVYRNGVLVADNNISALP